MDKMGFGYDRLRELKRDIILASVSGFGQYGPYHDRPAYCARSAAARTQRRNRCPYWMRQTNLSRRATSSTRSCNGLPKVWDGRPAPRSDRAGSARLSGSRPRSSSFNEVEKVGVQFVSVRDCEVIRRTRIDLEHGVLDHVGRRSGRGIDRDNLVITMDDQLATSNLCGSGV